MKKRSYAETNAYRNLLNPSADTLDECRKSITIYGYLKTWNNTYKRGCKMHYNDIALLGCKSDAPFERWVIQTGPRSCFCCSDPEFLLSFSSVIVILILNNDTGSYLECSKLQFQL